MREYEATIEVDDLIERARNTSRDDAEYLEALEIIIAHVRAALDVKREEIGDD